MNNTVRKLVPVICLAGAILFFVLGFNNLKAHRTYVKTIGEIVQISYDYDYVSENDNGDYHVFVSYTVEGREYESELGEYSSSMYEGEEIGIMYDPDAPARIIAASYTGLILTFGMSALCLAIAVFSGKELLKEIRGE